MNHEILKKAEKLFLKKYPGGFNHPEMAAIGKKHKMEQQTTFAKESFSKKAFENPNDIIANMGKLVSRSSMVSMFEKPKFRDMLKSLNTKKKEQLAKTLYELLHGRQQMGFEQFVFDLQHHKLGKWSLATIIQTYYNPNKEVFIKPTTAKLVIEKFGLELTYHPTPTWDFYKKYRKSILEMKKQVNPNIAPNTPAFGGFLMMTLPDV